MKILLDEDQQDIRVVEVITNLGHPPPGEPEPRETFTVNFNVKTGILLVVVEVE